jgi:hypothetical protein
VGGEINVGDFLLLKCMRNKGGLVSNRVVGLQGLIH